MASLPVRKSRWTRVAPLRGGAIRTIAEGSAVSAGVLIIALVLGLLGKPFPAPSVALYVLSWPAMLAWSAWRLSTVHLRRWWTRTVVGYLRIVIVGCALGGLQVILTWILPALASGYDVYRGRTWLIAASPFVLLGLRPFVRLAVLCSRPVTRRLRWQLLVSHLGGIAVTLAMLAAIDSIGALSLFLFGVRTDTPQMAAGVARLVRPASSASALDLAAAGRLARQIEAGNMWVRGESVLAPLLNQPLLPVRIAILDAHGNVLMDQERRLDSGPALIAKPLSPALRHALVRAAAVTDRRHDFVLPSSTVDHNTQLLGAAPVRDAAGRVRGVTVVQVLDASPSSSQFVTAALALFGATTVASILATAVPALVIAGLFSYFVARGLTQRLESVSEAANAIAAGDLSRRAPASAQNEIGQMARNFNEMAASLESAMREVEGARRQAEDALRTRQELVANISHELRTPLAIMRAHLEAVEIDAASNDGDASALPPAVSFGTFHALRAETERLARLVDDLFALARADTGALDVACAATDIAELLHGVAAAMRPLALQEGKISLTVDTPPGMPLAWADAGRLRQIIENLIRNAVRHTPEGGIISVSAHAERDWLVLAVADTGEGIPAEHLAHVFDRFYRVDEARTHAIGGAGLGLAIVREFVELMGGRVTVESKAGEGSCFRVYLPQAAKAPQEAAPRVSAHVSD